MFDLSVLFAQLVATGSIAAWMFTGVRDNILYPSQNENYTSEVMEMRRIQEGYPEAFESVKHRAITDRKTQLLAFRAIVVVEALACLILSIGTVMLGLALFGAASTDAAKAVALVGATIFMSVWAGMLIVGNHFSYWFGHEGAQFTHFMMCLWGLGVMVLLAA
jgi:predicted small integral membrane protein